MDILLVIIAVQKEVCAIIPFCSFEKKVLTRNNGE